MVVADDRCEMRYRINQSTVEYIAGSCALWRKEGHFISQSIVTNCGVSLHLSSMKLTLSLEKQKP
jgi:hypothetical protein